MMNEEHIGEILRVNLTKGKIERFTIDNAILKMDSITFKPTKPCAEKKLYLQTPKFCYGGELYVVCYSGEDERSHRRGIQ